jgi:hypothetical protein
MREALLKRQAERAAAEGKEKEAAAAVAEATGKANNDKGEASGCGKAGSRYVHMLHPLATKTEVCDLSSVPLCAERLQHCS